MTVNELIAHLQSLTPEQRALRITHNCEDRGFVEFDEVKEFQGMIYVSRGFVPMVTKTGYYERLIYLE